MVKQILSRFLALAAAGVVACSSSTPAPQTDSDQEAQRAFWAQPQNQARLEAFVLANVRFTLLHETAHYLFRVLDVPVAGREEDAADRFAVTLMIPRGAGPGGESQLTSSAEATGLVWAAYSFLEAGRGSLAKERSRIPWYDEHSVGEQRGYDIACLLYGSNPKRFELTAHDPEVGIPSEDRLARCPDESERNDRAYKALLGAFVLTDEEIVRRREEFLNAHQAAPRKSGSAAADILERLAAGAGTGTGSKTLLTMQPAGVVYHDYEARETWWNVPWFRWDSSAFVRTGGGVLEWTRDILLSLRLPEGTVIPTITAQGCGEANAFYGIDPSLFSTEERARQWGALLKKGLLAPQITICYELVDGFSWSGRALIWTSEQQKARRP